MNAITPRSAATHRHDSHFPYRRTALGCMAAPPSTTGDDRHTQLLGPRADPRPIQPWPGPRAPYLGAKWLCEDGKGRLDASVRQMVTLLA